MILLFQQGRSDLNHENEMFAKDHPEMKSLQEVVRLVKPTALIGRRKKQPTAQHS
jgi:malate dehydrogenase (oxaloacetate-decarboxylating)(NADP+)